MCMSVFLSRGQSFVGINFKSLAPAYAKSCFLQMFSLSARSNDWYVVDRFKKMNEKFWAYTHPKLVSVYWLCSQCLKFSVA